MTLRNSNLAAELLATADAPIAETIGGSSDTAIVAFSARHLKPGRFHFFGITEHFPEHSKILLRDPTEHWYNTGLPGIGANVEEIATWIRLRLESLGTTRVVTVGSSMGGYAAILFGCMLGAERIIAFTPQTLLDRRLGWLVPPPGIELQVPDLKPLVAASKPSAIDILVGREGVLDMFHAARVAALANVRVMRVADGRHDLARTLSRRGELWRLVADLLAGGDPSICEQAPEMDVEDIHQLHAAILSWHRGNSAEAIEILTTLADQHPDWQALQAALERAANQNRPA